MFSVDRDAQIQTAWDSLTQAERDAVKARCELAYPAFWASWELEFGGFSSAVPVIAGTVGGAGPGVSCSSDIAANWQTRVRVDSGAWGNWIDRDQAALSIFWVDTKSSFADLWQAECRAEAGGDWSNVVTGSYVGAQTGS